MPDEIRAPEVADAVRRRAFAELKETLRQTEPYAAVALIEAMGEDDRAVAFRMLGHDQAAEVFEYLEPEIQESLLNSMGRGRAASILDDMSPDDRTALLEELPATVTRDLINRLSPSERRIAVTLLGYPEDSIGRLMTPDYVRVKEHWTVAQVLEHIRKRGKDSETLNVIYVIDDRGKLVDDLRIRFLLLADPEARVVDLVDHEFVSLRATDDQEAAVTAFKEYDRVALPVVDSTDVLLGIVTFDDIMDVAEEEATEDIHKIGGLEALDVPYIQARFGEMIRKRAGWLVLLAFGQMLTANVLKAYESATQAAIELVVFLPLIISSGGNSGSQAATLIIRSLALGEVGLRDWWRVARREVLSGLALGAILAVVGFLRVAADRQVFGWYDERWMWLGLAVSASLLVVVLWGTLVGSMLPFVLQRLGADPAASSTPFVSTLVDVTGLLLYFGLATVLLRGVYL